MQKSGIEWGTFGLGTGIKRKRKKTPKAYNTRDSLVVTHPTTSLAVAGLSRGERTGSRVFQCLWSYVLVPTGIGNYVDTEEED